MKFALLAMFLGSSGCVSEAVGLGSLVMQGLGIGSGGTTPAAAGQAGPFRAPDLSQEMQALDDVTSRAVSQSCTASLAPKRDATSAASNAPSGKAPTAEPADAGGIGPNRMCGYRKMCLPGNVRPVTMFVCEDSSARTD